MWGLLFRSHNLAATVADKPDRAQPFRFVLQSNDLDGSICHNSTNKEASVGACCLLDATWTLDLLPEEHVS